MYTTNMYEGVYAETVTMVSANGDSINAYLARPLGLGPFPCMVLAHHMPAGMRGIARSPSSLHFTAT